MKFYLFILNLLLVAALTSCGASSKNKEGIRTMVFTSPLDSLKNCFKNDYSFTFLANNKVYKDDSLVSVIDELPIATMIFIDSMFYLNEGDERAYRIVYLKRNKIQRGFISESSVAVKFVSSRVDASTTFLGGFVPIEDGGYVGMLKSVRENRVIHEWVLDSGYLATRDIEIKLMDSVELNYTKELIYVSTSYSACSGDGNSFYFDYSSDHFTLIINEYGFGTDRYFMFPYIYLATSFDKTNYLYNRDLNQINYDLKNQVRKFKIPSNIDIPKGSLIYVEICANRDSLLNGEPVMQTYDQPVPIEYQEPITVDYIKAKKLYQWDGKKIVPVQL